MKRLNGIQFRAGVEAAAHKIASDFGRRITLRWNSNVTTAGINQYGDIYLANVADDAVVNQALVDKYTGFVVHELLHAKYTDFSANGNTPYLKQLHNAIEDAWIERTGIANKLTGNIEGLLTRLVNGMADSAMGQVKDWADPRQYPFVLAVYARGFCKRVPVAGGLEPIFAEATRRIDNCANSTDTLAVAQWVHNQLKGLQEDTPPKGSKGSQGGDQGKGEGEGAGDGENGQQEGQQDGQQEGQQAEQQVGNATAPTAKTRAREVEPSLKPSGDATGGTYTKAAVRKEAYHHSDNKAARDLTVSVPARMRYEVKKLFENTATEEFQNNHRAGSLDVRSLHKVDTTNRLFKRRLESEGIDSAVVILLDVSGSMFSIRYVEDARGKPVVNAAGDAYVQTCYIDDAVKTTAAMLDTLNRAQVKTAVLTFGSSVSVLKPFEMPLAKGLQRIARVDDGGDTNDYAALRYAHELLHGRPESRKVVFVITDGEGDGESVKAQCLAGEALGMTTIGIGIRLDVSDAYPKAVRVNNAANLGEVAFKQIKLAA